MEVHELKEFMDGGFKRVESRFDELKGCYDKLDEKVTSHDRWLWFIKGIGAILTILIGWLHIKLKIGG